MSTSEKLLSILDLFQPERPDWSVDEAAAVLEIPTSTTYRLFAALTASGLIAQFRTARYVLGPSIIRYDRLVRLTDPLLAASQQEMSKLAAIAPGKSVVFLCRLIGREVMCVDQAVSGRPAFATSYERGRPMPLFAGSASKVILANMPPRQIKAMMVREEARFEAAGLGGGWPEVKASLRAIRAAPVYVTRGEIDPGMRGMSVALAPKDMGLLASLSIAGPQAALDVAVVAKLEAGLRSAAEVISAKLKATSA